MDGQIATGRRRILAGIGAGATAFLAGCSALNGDDDDNGTENGNGNESQNGGGNTTDNGNSNETENGDSNGTENGGDENGNADASEREVGLIPTVDQAELQQIQTSYTAGEISQEEAQEQQQTLIQGEIDTLVTRVEGESNTEVVEELPESGGVRVTGTPSELLDIVEWEETEAIVAADIFDQPTVPEQ